MERMAEISRTAQSRPTEAEVRAYLPTNYRISDVSPVSIWIRGEDVAGWTLDDYVIPRLASGWITARELTGQELTDALVPAAPGIRYHSADDMMDALPDVTAPVAVIIRPDGSVDVYGYVDVVDQRL